VENGWDEPQRDLCLESETLKVSPPSEMPAVLRTIDEAEMYVAQIGLYARQSRIGDCCGCRKVAVAADVENEITCRIREY